MDTPAEYWDYETIAGFLHSTALPRVFPVRQHFPAEKLADPAAETRRRLEASGVGAQLRPGMRIAITGSSRGISNMNIVLREVAAFVKTHGGEPFIIPAMGSHGGATARGQREILTGYGITEAFCGCPILSSMEVDCIGTVEDDGKTLPVYVDRLAHGADGIIAVNRVKPHSAFRGPYESGIMKMLCIGLGKQIGADSLHGDGFGRFFARIPLFGNYVRTHCKVLCGVALVENAYDETCRIEVLGNEEIPEREPELLKFAFTQMPRILVPETDVLVVGEIGKNFSGSGMDPNITGTWSTPYGGGGIRKQRTAVLDLTEVSHGNGMGMGQADTTTRRFFRKLDLLATYPNALTSTVFLPIKLAMVLRDDRMAIQGALKTCNGIDQTRPRIVLIRNTLSMDTIWLSEAYWTQAQNTPGMEIAGPCREMPFDEAGNLLLWEDTK